MALKKAARMEAKRIMSQHEADNRTVRSVLQTSLMQAQDALAAIHTAAAQAEALGIIDKPYEQVRSIIYPGAPF